MAKGISLHIGLNAVDPAHYAGWSGPLLACEADAEDMDKLAQAQGFTATKLLTAAATRAAVTGAIEHAATTLGKGDIFFLTYSGHGGQVPDRNGDEPDDLQDETWCLHDGQLIDDELHALWFKFAPGVRVLVLSDSCHSGTVTKFALSRPGSAAQEEALRAYGVDEVRYRAMPDAVALRTYRQNAPFYDALQKRVAAGAQRRARGQAKGAAKGKAKKRPDGAAGGNPSASVRLISGCQDNQLSSDGTFNGLFTGMLLQVWNNAKFNGPYAAFHAAIVKRMPPTQTPKHFLLGAHLAAYDAQRPFTI